MKETGVYLRFGKPVSGKERESLALYAEALQYFREKQEQRAITTFEVFTFRTADYEEEAGFWVIRGEPEKISALIRDERWTALMSKAIVILGHFKVEMLRVGEEITEQMEQLAKVYAELGV